MGDARPREERLVQNQSSLVAQGKASRMMLSQLANLPFTLFPGTSGAALPRPQVR